jgi:hypothetical protein
MGMRFIDSRCIKCGANLRVPPDANLVCCQYCNSELQVVRDGSVLTTRLLESMEEMKGDLGHKLEILRVQNEIERLDREWNLQRHEFMVHGKHGSRIPSSAGSLIGGLLAAGFGLFWMVSAGSIGAPFPLMLFGIVFIVVAIVGAVKGMDKASRHKSADTQYQERRRALLSQLRDAERNP